MNILSRKPKPGQTRTGSTVTRGKYTETWREVITYAQFNCNVALGQSMSVAELFKGTLKGKLTDADVVSVDDAYLVTNIRIADANIDAGPVTMATRPQMPSVRGGPNLVIDASHVIIGLSIRVAHHTGRYHWVREYEEEEDDADW